MHLLAVSEQDWQSFLQGVPHHFFQTAAWGNILRKGYKNAGPEYWLLKQEGRPVLGLSGSLFDFGVMRLFFSNTPYGGFAGNTKHASEFLDLLEKELRKKRISRIRITQNFNQPHASLAGYQKIRSFQHVLFLEDETPESIFKKYDENGRRNIKKAVKEKVSVRPAQNREEAAVYHRMYLRTMRRNRVLAPHSLKLYEAIFDERVQKDGGDLFFAESQGKIIAGMLIIYADGGAYFIGSAFEAEAQTLRPVDYLMHHAVSEALRRKCSFFDLMTTADHQEGLLRFKEKWGGEKKDFNVYVKDLGSIAPKAWDLLWKFANSRVGHGVMEKVRSLQ